MRHGSGNMAELKIPGGYSAVKTAEFTQDLRKLSL
jgi:hypothetical protein